MSDTPAKSAPFRYPFTYVEQLAANGWPQKDLVTHERVKAIRTFDDFVAVARDMRAAAGVHLSPQQLRDYKLRPVETMRPHGLLDELGEIVDLFADTADSCQDQLDALDLDWPAAYKAAELMALGMPEADLQQLFAAQDPKKAINEAFDAEFGALRAFANKHSLRISDITLPAFEDVAKEAHPELDIVAYAWDDPVVVAARDRGAAHTARAASAAAAADPALQPPERSRKRRTASDGGGSSKRRRK